MSVSSLLIVSALYRLLTRGTGIFNGSGAVQKICKKNDYTKYINDLISGIASSSTLPAGVSKADTWLIDSIYTVSDMFPGMHKDDIDTIINIYSDLVSNKDDIVSFKKNATLALFGIDSETKRVISYYEKYTTKKTTEKEDKIVREHKSLETNEIEFPNSILCGVLYFEDEDETKSFGKAYLSSGKLNEAETLEALTFLMLHSHIGLRQHFQSHMKEYFAYAFDKEINEYNLPFGIDSYSELEKSVNMFYENKYVVKSITEYQDKLNEQCQTLK